MMRCYLLWHGGSNYAVPYAEDAEVFDSLRQLRDSFDSRLSDSYYPCVTDDEPENGGQEGWVFFTDPRELGGDLYPDRIISYGPRGGLHIVAA